MHNHKGSPKKLGKPAPGQSRHPTAFEAECCNLGRGDLISTNAVGEVSIHRCAKKYCASSRVVLDGEDGEFVVELLEEYWSR